MSADSPSSPEKPSPDSDLPSDGADVPANDDPMGSWDMDDAGESEESGKAKEFQPQPIASFGRGHIPDLKIAPNAPVDDRQLPDLVQSDVSQDGLRKSARKDIEVVEARKAFEDLEDVDAHEILAAEKKEAVDKPVFRKARPIAMKDKLPIAETQIQGRAKATMATPSVKTILSAIFGRSFFEVFSWVVLLALLVGFVVVVFVPAFRELPQKDEFVRELVYPIEGEYFTVRSAKTYWREPVLEGPNADIIRRGSVLLPVLEVDLQAASASAAIRVLFRGEDGLVLGDSVIRSIDDSQVMKIAATAGFDDMAMFAEYRTGKNELWTVEVYEASSVNDSIDEFKKLFEIKIDPLLH